MLARSDGAAAALGAVQVTADDIVAGSGRTVAAEVSAEALTPISASASAVSFAGEVDVRRSVSGPKGSVPTSDRLTAPIEVVRQGQAWKVKSLSFDGAALEYYPEGVEQTVQGIHLSLAFLLSNATSTNAVVSIYAEAPNLTVNLERVSLATASNTTHAGRAFFAHGVRAGLLGFPRVADRPARLDATFRESNGSTVSFSLALAGQPS
jgi:hypothetical protein